MVLDYRTVGLIAVALSGVVACETADEVVETPDANVGGSLNAGGAAGSAAVDAGDGSSESGANGGSGGAGGNSADASVEAGQGGADSASPADSGKPDVVVVSDADLRARECTAFCDAVAAACTGDNYFYDSLAHCYDICLDLPADVLNCRWITHLSQAVGDAGTEIHCPHTAGINQCVDE